jgi:MFS-type transporter involved in bile tolerance (Atg22 family)
MSETALERQDVGPRAAARVLRSPNFGPYFFGNAASASGTWFQNLAASLLVYRLTHSAFLLGVVNFSQFIPILVLAPWAGALADRFDRRRLLLLTQVAAAAVAGALAVLAWNGANEWVVIGFVFATGVTSAFSAPASQALIVQLVEERDVPQAVALNSMTYNLAGDRARKRSGGNRLARDPAGVPAQRLLLLAARRCAARRAPARAGTRRVAVAP